MVRKNFTKNFWHYQLVWAHLDRMCTWSTPTTSNGGCCPSQPLFSLTQTPKRATRCCLQRAHRRCWTPRLDCKGTQTQHHNSIQLQAQRGTQPIICDPACALLRWAPGGTDRVGPQPYHRMSGKTSPKLRENILHRRRKRAAVTFLHVGDACILKTKPLLIRAWQKSKGKKKIKEEGIILTR